jgi:hypothetical protein
MREAGTRRGNLGFVCAEGRSELMREIARLCILYEDLRLEIEELRVARVEPTNPKRATTFASRIFYAALSSPS